MRTTKAPSAEELRDQLVEHEREVEAAQGAIGKAALDGTNVTPATKRLAKARQGVELTKAALAELERRERATSEQQREAQASAERLRSYQWAAEFLARAEAVLEAHARAQAAEACMRSATIGRSSTPPQVCAELRRTRTSTPT
jgi:hypothetical protein